MDADRKSVMFVTKTAGVKKNEVVLMLTEKEKKYLIKNNGAIPVRVAS